MGKPQYCSVFLTDSPMCSAGPKSLENQESLDAAPSFPALAPLSTPQMALPPPAPASCAPKGTRTACMLLALPSQEKGLAHGGLQGIHPFSRGWDVEVVYKVTGLPCSCSLEKGWLARHCLNSMLWNQSTACFSCRYEWGFKEKGLHSACSHGPWAILDVLCPGACPGRWLVRTATTHQRKSYC